MNYEKKLAILFAGMTLLGSLVGCGNQATSAPPASGDGEPSADNLRFTFVCPIQGNVYWNTAVDGMEAAAAELGGIDISVVGPTTLDTNQFIKDLDSAVASQPDGIMLMCYDEAMLSAGIDNATNSGIPLVTIDSDGPNTSRIAYYGTENFDAGVIAGETMVELTGGKAKIIIETADLAANNMVNRMDGFKSVIEKYPDMEILNTVLASDVLEGAEVASQFLTAYPECNAVFCAEGQGPKGIAQTLVERDLTDKVTMVTFDEDEELLTYIKNGSIKATVTQDPYTMGYECVKTLHNVVNGGEVEQVVNNIPVTAITQDNVDDALAKYQ